MDKTKSISTLMNTSCSLDKDEGGKPIEESRYWDMIVSLLYLIASCNDIMFGVCLCACLQANPKESHLTETKCIMRYFTSTLLMGLWYPKGTYSTLVGYSDFDFSRCKLDRKSTNGMCHLFGNSFVFWHKKQARVAISTV